MLIALKRVKKHGDPCNKVQNKREIYRLFKKKMYKFLFIPHVNSYRDLYGSRHFVIDSYEQSCIIEGCIGIGDFHSSTTTKLMILRFFDGKNYFDLD